MNPASLLYSDPSGWLEVVAILESQLGDLPIQDWKPILPYTSSSQQSDPDYISRELLRVHKEHVSDCFSAVLHRHQEQVWPVVSPATNYYLRLMHGRALMFLPSIVFLHQNPPQTIFAFPNAHPNDLVYWLLTDWWLEVGLFEMIEEQSRRNDPSSFDFS